MAGPWRSVRATSLVDLGWGAPSIAWYWGAIATLGGVFWSGGRGWVGGLMSSSSGLVSLNSKGRSFSSHTNSTLD